MRLSYLLSVLSEIQKFDAYTARTNTAQGLEWVKHTIENAGVTPENLVAQLTQEYNLIQNTINQYDSTVTHTINNIKSQILLAQPEYLSNSFKLFDEQMRPHDVPKHVLDRTLGLSVDQISELTTRIATRADWHHPGMIIRPGRESWIENMVALDPLYVVDECEELLEPIDKRFNPQYVSRLRKIVIDNSRSSNILEAIPDAQIAFCLIYNYFNFRPMEVITQFLREIFNKLKPGGVVAMTVNDCDRPGGVALTERNFACYTPLSMIVNVANSMGYQVVHSIELSSATTWLELAKPGTLTSLRGGQSLAKIFAKS